VQKLCSFSKYLFFPKNNIKGCTKETKTFYFGFLGPTRINHCSYVSPFTMKNQGYVVLYEKLFGKYLKNDLFIFYNFENLFI